jgi:hypothetical protein
MSVVVLLSIIEIVLLVADRTFLIFNLKHYYDEGDTVWMAATFFFISLPGILEVIYWVSQLEVFCGEVSFHSREFWKWIVFGLFFPISIIYRHVKIAVIGRCDGQYIEEKYANLRVLKSLQSFSESAPQIVLQGYIIIRTWNRLGKKSCLCISVSCFNVKSLFLFSEDHYLQLLCIVTGLLMLAKSCSEHHYYEVSGKTHIPGLKDIAVSYLYYLIHILSRTASFSLIFAYYHHYAVALVLILLFSNLSLAFIILRHNFIVKTIWTSVASILAPVCFVSVHAVEMYNVQVVGTAERRFRRYYFWNALAFVIIVMLTMLTFNLLSAYEVIEFRKLNLPILTFGYPMTVDVMGWGTFTWIGMALISSLIFGLAI